MALQLAATLLLPRKRTVDERLASKEALAIWQKASDESEVEEEDFTKEIHEGRKRDKA